MSSNSIFTDKNPECRKSLVLRNAVKRFRSVTAVDQVSLEINECEIFSLLGPSGCGKTTLLRLVAGFEYLDEGDILIDGNVVNDLPPDRRECNIVFQQHALFPHLTVFDNVAFGLVERRLPKSEIIERVMEAIGFINLHGMEKRYPSQLSGGQQQRVALARSLVLEPKILLLDEPLAALDRKLRKEMQTELKRIQREVGITFLNVTHDQKEALGLSDRIAVMNEGKIVQVGTPAEIYAAPNTKFVAAFMGATNIFIGQVANQTGALVELFTSEGLCTKVLADEAIADTSIEGMSIHPELIQIASNSAGEKFISSEDYTAVNAIIEEVFYQGDFSELTLTVLNSDQTLTVHLNRGLVDTIDVSEGKEVVAYWDWHHNNALYCR